MCKEDNAVRISDIKTKQDGLSLIEALMATGLLAFVISVGPTMWVQKMQAQQKALGIAEIEDLRQYIRLQMSCSRSIWSTAGICDTDSTIALQTHDGKLLTVLPSSTIAGHYDVRGRCGPSFGQGIVQVEYHHKNTPSNATPFWKNLFGNVPKFCQAIATPSTNIGSWNCTVDWSSIGPLSMGSLPPVVPTTPGGYTLYLRPRLTHCNDIAVSVKINSTATGKAAVLPCTGTNCASGGFLVPTNSRFNWSIPPAALAGLVDAGDDPNAYLATIAWIADESLGCGGSASSYGVAMALVPTGTPVKLAGNTNECRNYDMNP
jgi:hypothetical protein